MMGKIECKVNPKHQGEMQSHHVWCKFMDNPHGNTFREGQPNRYWLCKECHIGKTGLHQTLIIPMLNKFAGTLKYNGSESLLWKQIPLEDKPKVILSITEATINWVEKRDRDGK